MHTDMTAVTIQSNKNVLNEVKDNSGLLEPLYGKKNKLTLWPTHYLAVKSNGVLIYAATQENL